MSSKPSKAQLKVLERMAAGDTLDYVSWGSGRASIGFKTVHLATFYALRDSDFIKGKQVGTFSYDYTITDTGRAALAAAKDGAG